MFDVAVNATINIHRNRSKRGIFYHNEQCIPERFYSGKVVFGLAEFALIKKEHYSLLINVTFKVKTLSTVT